MVDYNADTKSHLNGSLLFYFGLFILLNSSAGVWRHLWQLSLATVCTAASAIVFVVVAAAHASSCSLLAAHATSCSLPMIQAARAHATRCPCFLLRIFPAAHAACCPRCLLCPCYSPPMLLATHVPAAHTPLAAQMLLAPAHACRPRYSLPMLPMIVLLPRCFPDSPTSTSGWPCLWLRR